MARHPLCRAPTHLGHTSMRTVWFHRGAYKRLYGAHLKHAHYVRHAADMAGFVAKITFTGAAGNDTLEGERLALWPPHEFAHAARWDPQAEDILFLTGFDWELHRRVDMTEPENYFQTTVGISVYMTRPSCGSLRANYTA